MLAVRTERERERRYNRLENAIKDRLYARRKQIIKESGTETVA